ncbi:hypothetical protein [Deinococcus peraridilitoris]|uniref:Uncharacterized protein n=1 Tax=Deinococcus peraridilitoris (strain DSM 19664 / LMG 22246 / CIP 109416 / KR-200) TaxID=937777 RepID=L0A9B5_DEIPD|nr:hypothetical protein [Deinococcus peraridilitoris]AFZ69722.1 hypothetical protein Deipe_4385 [Deinococcus peraridilitoris DSM 19664]
MSAGELWQFALAHHVPYFIVGMLLIWFWPNLTTWFDKAREARLHRDPEHRQFIPRQGATGVMPAELRAKIEDLNARQEDVARQLAALQRPDERGNRKEQA